MRRDGVRAGEVLEAGPALGVRAREVLEAGPAARAKELCHGRSEEPEHCHESPLGPHPPGNNSRGQDLSVS